MKPIYEKGTLLRSIARMLRLICDLQQSPLTLLMSQTYVNHQATLHIFLFTLHFQCIVANVDADAANNRPLAEKYEVGSFPTIKFFPKGNKGP